MSIAIINITTDVPQEIIRKMKIKKNEIGIAIALTGFFGGMLGFGIARLWWESLGLAIFWVSWMVVIIGILLNFWIIYKKK